MGFNLNDDLLLGYGAASEEALLQQVLLSSDGIRAATH